MQMELNKKRKELNDKDKTKETAFWPFFDFYNHNSVNMRLKLKIQVPLESKFNSQNFMEHFMKICHNVNSIRNF